MSAFPDDSTSPDPRARPAACPKCGAARPAGATDCPSCGIVYAKVEALIADALVRARTGRAGEESGAPGSPRRELARSAHGAPLETPRTTSVARVVVDGRGLEDRAVAGAAFWASCALWVVLAYLTIQFARHSVASNFAGESPLHLVNLVFHEAGHVVFSPLGRVVMVFGGSLLQVIVPIACAVAFVRRGDRFATSVATWWAGQNLVDLAPYVNDARALQLVLLGGRTGAEVEGHDWEFLLQTFGIQHLDHGIAGALQAVGIVAMTAALAWGAWELKKLRHANDESDAGSGTAQFSDGGADFSIGR